MIYKYISVKYIIESLYRNYGPKDELDIWDVIEWAGEALEFIGAYPQYRPQIAEVCVTDHRGCLPADFHQLNGPPTYNGVPMDEADGTMEISEETTLADNYVNATEVSATSFPQSVVVTSPYTYRYYINDNYIITSFAEGCVLISYKAIPTDADGFPMVPDNVSYKKAITIYCQMMMDNLEWRKGRIPDKVYMDSKQDWQWYCGQAGASGNMPNTEKAEAIKNTWMRLRPRINERDNLYTGLGQKEQKKIL